MKRPYNRLTVFDRKNIENWYNKQGLDPLEIAKLTGTHLATIYRELQRGKTGIFYNAELAQENLKRGKDYDKTSWLFERCSMCPNGPVAAVICPPGYLKKNKTVCRFVNTYTDEEGHKYKVTELEQDLFLICFERESEMWEPLVHAMIHDNFDDAQEELNRRAAYEEWHIWSGGN